MSGDHYDRNVPPGTPIDVAVVTPAIRDGFAVNEEHRFVGGVTATCQDGALILTSGQGYVVAYAPGEWSKADVNPGEAR